MKYREGVAERHDIPWNHVGREDVARMQIQFRKTSRDNKWIPTWALDDRKVRHVVYVHLFNYARRAGVDGLKPGMSLMEIEKLACEQRVVFASLDRYNGGRDAHLLSTENGIAARTVALIYGAYRERQRGVVLAERLNMSHTCVRQCLKKLNDIARKLYPEDCVQRRHWTKKDVLKKWVKGNCPRKTYRPEDAPDFWKKVAAEYNAGATLASLETKYDLNYHKVRWHLLKYGLVDPNRIDDERSHGWKMMRLMRQDKDNVIAAYQAGKSIQGMAKQYQVSYMCMHKFLVKIGVHQIRSSRSNCSTGRPKYSRVLFSAVRDEAIELYKNGVPIAQIAKQLGLHLNSLNTRLWQLRKKGVIQCRRKVLKSKLAA
jgi:hypothetical protein